MKPYLKGFHLSLEIWRGGRDAEGWKVATQKSQAKMKKLDVGTGEEGNEDTTFDPESIGMENTKQDLLGQFLVLGMTTAAEQTDRCQDLRRQCVCVNLSSG